MEIHSQKVHVFKDYWISRPRKLILFGSFVHGDMHMSSDLDILVITGDDISNTRTEEIRTFVP